MCRLRFAAALLATLLAQPLAARERDDGQPLPCWEFCRVWLNGAAGLDRSTGSLPQARTSVIPLDPREVEQERQPVRHAHRMRRHALDEPAAHRLAHRWVEVVIAMPAAHLLAPAPQRGTPPPPVHPPRILARGASSGGPVARLQAPVTQEIATPPVARHRPGFTIRVASPPVATRTRVAASAQKPAAPPFRPTADVSVTRPSTPVLQQIATFPVAQHRPTPATRAASPLVATGMRVAPTPAATLQRAVYTPKPSPAPSRPSADVPVAPLE